MIGKKSGIRYLMIAALVSLTLVTSACNLIKKSAATPTPTKPAAAATAVTANTPASATTANTPAAAATKAPASTPASAATSAPASTPAARAAGTPTGQAQVLAVPTVTASAGATTAAPKNYTAPTPALPAVTNISAQAKPVVKTYSDIIAKEGDEKSYQIDLSTYKNGGFIEVELTMPKTTEGGGYTYLVTEPNGVTTVLEGYVSAGEKSTYAMTIDEPAVYPLTVKSDSGYNPKDPFGLKVTFTPNSANAKADTSTAVKVPALIKSTINSATDHNWYAIDLSSYPNGGLLRGTITMPAKTEDGGYSYQVVESDKTTRVFSNYVGPADKGSFAVTIEKGGLFYLDVYGDFGYNAKDPYTFQIDLVPNSPNYTANTAAEVGYPAKIQAWINSETDRNWFKVDFSALPANAPVTATLTMPAKLENGSGYTMDAFDSDKTTRLDSIYAGPASKSVMKLTLKKPGIVYFEVRADNGYNPKDQYTLTIEGGAGPSGPRG